MARWAFLKQKPRFEEATRRNVNREIEQSYNICIYLAFFWNCRCSGPRDMRRGYLHFCSVVAILDIS